MATNTGNGRKGAIRKRTQVLNPKTNIWTKRGPDGKFMDGKSDHKPFKSVTKVK